MIGEREICDRNDALSYACRVQREAAALGFDWPDIHGALDKAQEELDELRDALKSKDISGARRELGDIFFTAVNLSRFLDTTPSDALRESTQKFTNRFEKVREAVEKSGREWKSYSLRELDVLWDEIKVRAEQGLEEGG